MGWNQLKFEVGRAELENSLAVGVRGCCVGKLKGTECRRDAWRGDLPLPWPRCCSCGGLQGSAGDPSVWGHDGETLRVLAVAGLAVLV